MGGCRRARSNLPSVPRCIDLPWRRLRSQAGRSCDWTSRASLRSCAAAETGSSDASSAVGVEPRASSKTSPFARPCVRHSTQRASTIGRTSRMNSISAAMPKQAGRQPPRPQPDFATPDRRTRVCRDRSGRASERESERSALPRTGSVAQRERVDPGVDRDRSRLWCRLHRFPGPATKPGRVLRARSRPTATRVVRLRRGESVRRSPA